MSLRANESRPMRKRTKKQKTLPAEDTELRASANPLAGVDDGLTKNLQRSSSDLIHEAIMRGGGEPFGQPFSVGTSTLTEKIVRFFKQHGFFGFETYESRTRKPNKFTRYGASRHRGPYRIKKER